MTALPQSEERSSPTIPDPGARTVLAGPCLAEIAARFGTPVWVYDRATIEQQFERLRKFDVVRYAQKACSNIHVLRILRNCGALVDAVSVGEIERALSAGWEPGADPAPIVYAADVFDRRALERVLEHRIPVNAGSPQMLEQIGQRSPGHPVWLRVNPGFGHGHSRKTNTGGEHSKHGIWHTELDGALRLVDRYHLDLVGLHMHIGSGADYAHLERVCEAMVELLVRLGRDIHSVSAGGGLSVPYQDDEPEIDTDRYFAAWNQARQEIERTVGHRVTLEIEPGRFLVASSGVLLSEVRANKPVGRNRFIIVDAGFNDLMRPAMYGSTHRVLVLRPNGSQVEGPARPTVIAGPLCESGDVFTQSDSGEVTHAFLPQVSVGDLIAFRDAGAYGASMSSNYNSRPLAPEVLLEDDNPRLIRRRQRIEELLALEKDV